MFRQLAAIPYLWKSDKSNCSQRVVVHCAQHMGRNSTWVMYPSSLKVLLNRIRCQIFDQVGQSCVRMERNQRFGGKGQNVFHSPKFKLVCQYSGIWGHFARALCSIKNGEWTSPGFKIFIQKPLSSLVHETTNLTYLISHFW